MSTRDGIAALLEHKHAAYREYEQIKKPVEAEAECRAWKVLRHLSQVQGSGVFLWHDHRIYGVHTNDGYAGKVMIVHGPDGGRSEELFVPFETFDTLSR